MIPNYHLPADSGHGDKPLFSALSVGAISIEADIFSFQNESNLYVGHSLASLTKDRTLKNLYLDPLLEILDGQNPSTSFLPKGPQPPNGVYDTNDAQTLYLFLDIKNEPNAIFPMVLAALESLKNKDYLTHWDGTNVVSRPLTVVLTGDAPFSLISSSDANPDGIAFYDSPLNDLTGDQYQTSNTPIASTS